MPSYIDELKEQMNNSRKKAIDDIENKKTQENVENTNNSSNNSTEPKSVSLDELTSKKSTDVNNYNNSEKTNNYEVNLKLESLRDTLGHKTDTNTNINLKNNSSADLNNSSVSNNVNTNTNTNNTNNNNNNNNSEDNKENKTNDNSIKDNSVVDKSLLNTLSKQDPIDIKVPKEDLNDANNNNSINKEDDSFSKHIESSIESSSKNKLNMEELKKKNTNVDEFEHNWNEKAHLVTKYGEVEIYRIDGELQLHYRVPTPKPSPSQKLIINTLKEAATRLITTDPYKIRDPLQRQNIYYQKIMDILENAPEINIPKHLFAFYANAVVKEMVGYGIIEPLLHDEKLEEIMIVGPTKPTYVYHVDYGMMTSNVVFYSDEQIYEIIDKIARTLGRRVDISNPLLDARLPDGSRVNATIPPASIDGSSVTIRKFKKDPYTIVDLLKFGTINIEVAAFLWSIVDGFRGTKPANIVISGGTGSGKTTTLNILANFIPESDRILTIEDTAELRLPIKHVIRFEGRPPGLEGKGELSLDVLVKNTLRMRPDRIVVGEIRHKEALSLFTAMNTGHDGCMGTIHANSARETLVRITSPPMEVPMLMLAGLDFIIVQKRLNTNKGTVRRITAIAEITGVLDNKPQANIIFKWNPQTDSLERTEKPIEYFDMIKSLTKLSDEDIKNKIAQRIKFLNDLVNKNIRTIEEVSAKVQDSYILERNN